MTREHLLQCYDRFILYAHGYIHPRYWDRLLDETYHPSEWSFHPAQFLPAPPPPVPATAIFRNAFIFVASLLLILPTIYLVFSVVSFLFFEGSITLALSDPTVGVLLFSIIFRHRLRRIICISTWRTASTVASTWRMLRVHPDPTTDPEPLQEDEDSAATELAENREDPEVDGASSNPDKTLTEEKDWVSGLSGSRRTHFISPQSSPSRPLVQVVNLQLEVNSRRNPPPPE